nr:hypothetical protein Iba_chr06aCG11220 [Ipomoea batatas]GME07713.1 hypothetical protein Iba_scaffold6462CG0240 [Ipomoea batatas]
MLRTLKQSFALSPSEEVASAAGLPSSPPQGVSSPKGGCHGRTRRRSRLRREEEGERRRLPLLKMAFPQAATGSAMSLRRRKDCRHYPRPNAIDELSYHFDRRMEAWWRLVGVPWWFTC